MKLFEEYIKGKLDGYEPEVPPHIWDNIEARKKKRRFIWFFFEGHARYISLSLFILAISFYQLTDLDNNISQTDNKTTTSSSSVISPNVSSGNITPSGGPVSQHLDDDNNNDLSAIELKQTSSQNTIISGANRLPSSQFSISSNKNTYHSNSRLETNPTAKSSVKRSLVARMANEAEKNIGNFQDPTVSRQDQSSDESSSAAIVQSVDGSQNSTNIIIRESLSINDIAKSGIIKLQSGQTPAISLSPFYFNPKRLMDRLPALTLMQMSGRKNYSIPPCPGELPSNSKKYLELYTGPDLVFTSYSDTSSSNYIDKRKSASQVSFAYSSGARFTKVFGNGMSVKTGLNFSHIIERFSVLQGNILQIVYIFGPSGDTLGNYATRTSRYFTNYNNYHTIDIPLLVGYEMNIGKWKANLNAGVIMNLYSWQNGLMIDTSGKVVSIKSGSGAQAYQFKTNMGAGFLGSLSLYYPIREGLYFLAEPYFRYNLAAANKEEISLRQKFQNTGIRFGLRYDLKNK